MMRPYATKLANARFASTLVLLGLCYLLLIINREGWAEAPSLRIGPRSLALGEAMTGVSDDEDLLFYNPSGLVRLEESRLTLVGLRVTFNSDAVNVINEFSDAYGKTKPAKGEKSYERIDHFSPGSLKKLGDLHPLARLAGPLQMTYIRRGFAVSLINPELIAQLDVVGPAIHFRGQGDMLGMVSYARRVYRNLSAGLTIKYLVRSEIGKGGKGGLGPKLTAVIAQESDTYMFMKRGRGYDLGLTYEMDRFPLTIGLALLDFTGTTLNTQVRKLSNFDQVGKDEKSTIDSRFALGVAYRPDFKIPIRPLAYIPEELLLAFALTSGESFSERFHLGVEVKPYRWVGFRLGVQDGIRLGVGLRSRTVALDYMFAPSLKDPYLNEKTENNHLFSWMVRY